jgi:hypothetical protein
MVAKVEKSPWTKCILKILNVVVGNKTLFLKPMRYENIEQA